MPHQRAYARFTIDVWNEIQRRMQDFPRHAEFAELLRFDYRQLFNVMRYSRLMDEYPEMFNLVEHDLYTPHNMHMMISATMDLMCSPRFDRSELAILREVVWRGQCMGRIGNLVTTWQREIGEDDFTSGVFARAISCGDLAVSDLWSGNREYIEGVIRGTQARRVFPRPLAGLSPGDPGAGDPLPLGELDRSRRRTAAADLPAPGQPREEIGNSIPTSGPLRLAGKQATAVKQSLTEKYFQRFGHHYILLMMILTRLGGLTGGLLVIFYAVLTLRLDPDASATTSASRPSSSCCSRAAHRADCAVGAAARPARAANVSTGASRSTRTTQSRRDATRSRLPRGITGWRPGSPRDGLVARARSILRSGTAPRSTVMINITLSVFMGIALALVGHFFAVEHCMRPVIRHLLSHGVSIDYHAVPQGSLRFRLGFCSLLIVTTTALMIGTVARQRASDIIDDPDKNNQVEAVQELRTHSIVHHGGRRHHGRRST